MSVKVFQTNKAGKIEFTRCELEKLLNETYNEGYRDGENHAKSSYWTWTSPLAKTVDAMLSGKHDFATMFANPIGNTNVNGAKKAVEDNPFTNLAKELTTL